MRPRRLSSDVRATTILCFRPDSPGANRNPQGREIFPADFRGYDLLVVGRDAGNLNEAPPWLDRGRRLGPGKSDRLNPCNGDGGTLDPLRIVDSLLRIRESLKRAGKNRDIVRGVAKRRTGERDKRPQRSSGRDQQNDSCRTLDQRQETMSPCRSSRTHLASPAHTGNQPRT